MQLQTSLALFLAAVASATDLRLYSGGGCGGGYVQCGNVGAGTCCTISDLNGATSIQVVFAGRGTQLFGYQRTRDGNYCGSIFAQQATGGSDNTCISVNPSFGTFAAARWYPPGKVFRRKADAEMCPPTSTEECSGIAVADKIVLSDGHAFDIKGADPAAIKKLVSLLVSGATSKDVPKELTALEHN